MNFIIVGAGGMGREVFSWLTHTITNQNDKIKGFIDDNPEALGNLQYTIKIIGNILDYRPTTGEALEEAIANYDCPEIFYTDQGSQFTADVFTDTLNSNNIAISMDCKGRWMDNVLSSGFGRA